VIDKSGTSARRWGGCIFGPSTRAHFTASGVDTRERCSEQYSEEHREERERSEGAARVDRHA
jgi:hypothetical protein